MNDTTFIRPWPECLRLVAIHLTRNPLSVVWILISTGALAAGIMTYRIPGVYPYIYNVVSVSVIWIALYIWVAASYLRANAGEDDRTTRVLAVVFLMVVLAAIVLSFIPIVATVYFTFRKWSFLFWALGLIAITRRFLPEQTQVVTRVIRSSPSAAIVSSSFAAIFLAESLVFVLASQTPVDFFRLPFPSIPALLLNMTLLMGVMGVLFCITRRSLFSIAVVLTAYGLFAVCNAFKLRYLATPIQALDWYYLNEVVPFVFNWHWITIMIVVILVVSWLAMMIFLWRRPPSSISARLRGGVALSWCLALVAVFVVCSLGSSRLRALAIGATGGWDPLRSVLRNGMLIDFVLNANRFTVPAAPEGYSRQEIERIANKLDLFPTEAKARAEEPVNVVVYMVESLARVEDLGLQVSGDPHPYFSLMSAQSGNRHAFVSKFAAGSSNSEFELLTGMSMFFLPPGSSPYVQFVKRDVPSLPRLLRSNGYRTAAIHVTGPEFYSRAQAYQHLGFDQTHFLAYEPDIERTAVSKFATDDEVVNRIIKVSENDQPYFIFAHPASTHFPFVGEPSTNEKGLEVTGEYDADVRSEFQVYVNRVCVADHALGRLVEHFKESQHKTMIVVFGDHMPPFSMKAHSALSSIDSTDEDENLVRRHRVPLAIWSNYAEQQVSTCSLNFLGTQILHELGIDPTKLFKLAQSTQHEIFVLSGFGRTKDGTIFHANTRSADIGLVKEYGLVQYDLLFGKQYLERHTGAAELSP